MLFLNKRVAVSPSSAFSSPTRVTKSQVQNNIKTLTKEIEKAIEEREGEINKPKSSTSLTPFLKKAKDYDFFKTKEELLKTISSMTASRKTILHFFKHLFYQVLSSTSMADEKASFFQLMANYREQPEDFTGLHGFNFFLFSYMNIPQEKLDMFLNVYKSDPQNPKWIIGTFGSHKMCTVTLELEGFEPCSGVILKQKVHDEDSSGYIIYVFDNNLKASIEEEIALQSEVHTEDHTEDHKKQKPVFELDLLRALCLSFANEAMEENAVEVTVVAELFRTPGYRGSTPSRITYSGLRPAFALSTTEEEVAKRLFSKPSDTPTQDIARRMYPNFGDTSVLESGSESTANLGVKSDVTYANKLAGTFTPTNTVGEGHPGSHVDETSVLTPSDFKKQSPPGT